MTFEGFFVQLISLIVSNETFVAVVVKINIKSTSDSRTMSEGFFYMLSFSGFETATGSSLNSFQ